MEEIASRARCGDDRKIAGFAVKRIIAAVFSVVPGNLRIADAGQIGIHHALLVVDLICHLAPLAGLVQLMAVSCGCASAIVAETAMPIAKVVIRAAGRRFGNMDAFR